MSLGSGWYHNCVAISGAVTCWGHNGAGQLGDGGDIFVPDCGDSCGGDTLPAPDAFGPYPVAGIADVVKVDGGWYNTCAITSAGAAACWGMNSTGVLGDWPDTWSSSPVAVGGLENGVVDISAGYNINCAVTDDGKVHCWGGEAGGGLGTGTDEASSTPVEVTGLSGRAVAVSVGNTLACVLFDTGSVDCWEAYGASTPAPVPALGNDVAQLSAGEYHTCAVMKDGTARCWGTNYDGELGDGTMDDSDTPVEVQGLANAVGIAAGTQHTCAVLQDGTVKCWGANYDGELGDGTNDGSISPVNVLGITDAIAVSAGEAHVCALLSTGKVLCWGSNGFGLLGQSDDVLESSSEPLEIAGVP